MNDLHRDDFARLAGAAPSAADVADTVRHTLAARARRRRNIGVGAVVAAVLAVGGVMTLTTSVRPDGDRPAAAPSSAAPSERPSGSSGRCYATADLDRSDNFVSFATRAGRTALDVCGHNWATSVLSAQEPFTAGPAGPAEIPPLVVCVLPGEVTGGSEPEIGVFPGDPTTCAHLGLTVF